MNNEISNDWEYLNRSIPYVLMIKNNQLNSSSILSSKAHLTQNDPASNLSKGSRYDDSGSKRIAFHRSATFRLSTYTHRTFSPVSSVITICPLLNTEDKIGSEHKIYFIAVQQHSCWQGYLWPISNIWELLLSYLWVSWGILLACLAYSIVSQRDLGVYSALTLLVRWFLEAAPNKLYP